MNLIATAPVTVDIKDSVMTNFKEMVYARTEEIYEDRKNAFLLSTAGIQVRTNKQYVPLKEQFMNNWDSCKEMWVLHYRSGLPTLGDNTNNRLERTFWTLKEHMRSRFPKIPVIQRSIGDLIPFCDQRIEQGLSWAETKSLRIYDKAVESRSITLS